MFIKAASSIFIILSSQAFANDINIRQSGADFNLTISQQGQNNGIGANIWSVTNDVDGDDNDLEIKQYNNKNGNRNYIGFHIDGDGNNFALGQGCYYDNSSDTTCDNGDNEYGNQRMMIDVHGSGNNMKHGQRNAGSFGHDLTTYIYGNDNNVFTRQNGSGAKDMTIQLSGNNHSVSMIQDGQGAHNASVNLSAGAGAYSLSLTQSSDSTQNYSLTGTCQDSNGCGVTVTQN